MLRSVVVILLCSFGLPGMSTAASAPVYAAIDAHEEAVIRQVLEMERECKEAALHNDVEFATRTLAEDYLAIGPLGNVTTKDDTLAARRNGKIHYDTIDISEMAVRVYGDMAVVTARAQVKGSNLGEDFSGPYRFTRVWVKRDGQWKTVSYQATATMKSE